MEIQMNQELAEIKVAHDIESKEEIDARDYELKFRAAEDVARYGTMLKSVQDSYDDRLEAYLRDDFNWRIYCEYRSSAWGGLFDGLELFRILAELRAFVETNAANPLTIEKGLRALDYSVQQNYYLLEALTKRLAWESQSNNDLKIALKVSREEVNRLWRQINWQHLETFNQNFHHFNIFALQQHLTTLDSNSSRVGYLIKLKANLRQSFINHEPPFLSQVDAEIEKLQQLGVLGQSENSNVTTVTERRREGGTQHQTLLAMHYLLKSLTSKENNTKKAQLASFLTGFSKNTFRQQWSNVHSKQDKGLAWVEDMRIVRHLFEELGLEASVKLIDSDLESQSEQKL